MYVHKLVVCMCCLVGALVLSEGRQPRRRHETCDYEKYEHEGKTCCPCPSGFRVLSDCTDKDATKCEMCKLGSFMTHPNRDHTCQPCKTCNPNANMETKKNCSFYSDTVCTCKKYHYCDKGDLCRVCYPCDTCEEHGDVKIPCTETNNTVCRDAQGSDSTVTIVAVLLSFVFIGAFVVFCLFKKKIFRCNDKQRRDPKEATELLDLKDVDVDLNYYLPDIVSILGLNLMKDVARRTGMTNVDIENHVLNSPGNVKEQTYNLLEDWYQRQGLKGAYPTLIKTLLHIKEKENAEQIQQIVEKGQATAQPKTDQNV
ncbi:tumor necrosis factor receptor superfamily member 6-like isoform X2 [Myxocyprinus asiaticus]|uniref:tumor necrosis factor receptor superfamily member 6-like isoform X2 n=1 Tax=Myxocyprinus asiaticus TaxID=70543 RepID=UPI002221D158|nr:tumor necrosis factor receptor superfamily member 6-like isoform X2 [Myxocyprinus asiaticus]